jgi:hypothetical protein
MLLPLALLALVLADGAARTGDAAWRSEISGLLGSGLLGRAVIFLLGMVALSLPILGLAAVSRLQARRRERRARQQAGAVAVELAPALGRPKA